MLYAIEAYAWVFVVVGLLCAGLVRVSLKRR